MTTINSSSSPGPAFGVVVPDTGTSPTATIPTDTLTITSSDGSVVVDGDDSTNTIDLTLDAGSVYTDEQAQDAVGTILVDSAEVDFTYNDAGPTITADLKNGISATRLADGSVDNTEFQSLNGVTSGIQGQLDGKQPLDATLTALAGLNATAGIVVETAADAFTKRSVAAGSSKVSVTNGDGVSGNPTVDVVEANLDINNQTGTLPINRGGTGQTAANAAFNALAPTTTKGDLIAFSTVNARVPVGADGTVLTADSGAATGVSWQSGGSYTDEQAQDSVGTILVDSAEIDFTYSDATPSITAGLKNGIAATRIADGSVSDAEFQRLDGVTSGIQGQIDGKQPLDATLTALAGLNSTAGLVVETAADTFTKRSIAVTAPLTIANADGASANPTIGLSAEQVYMVPSRSIEIFDDFLTGSTETGEVGNYSWSFDVAGTGAAFARKPGLMAHPGIVEIKCGTVATGRSCVYAGTASEHFVKIITSSIGDANCAITMEFLVKVAGTITNKITSIQVGLGDSFQATTDQGNGVYFEIKGTDTNWFFVCQDGTPTRRDTGVAYSDGAWIRLGAVMNAAGSSWQAYVNGTSAGAAVTTGISNQVISPFFKTVGIASGSNIVSWLDYYYLRFDAGANRETL